MPRPQRIEYNGAWYHVVNRREGRRPLFRTNEHYEFFLDLLGDVSETYSVEFHAYCLTDSVFHLIVHTPYGNLSTAMRHLNSVYTQFYNRERNTGGSIFRDRYKAVLLDKENFLTKVSRYIHFVPVILKLANRPEQYPWSSFCAYIGKAKSPAWLHKQDILGFFSKRNAAKQYEAFVKSGVDEQTLAFYGKKSLSSIFGEKRFVTDAKRLRQGKRPSAHLQRGEKTIPKPKLNVILQATANKFSVDRKTLNQEMRGRGGGNTARAVAMLLARNPGGYSLNEIAESLKVGDISTVSVAVKRMKTRLTTEPTLAKKVDSLKNELFIK